MPWLRHAAGANQRWRRESAREPLGCGRILRLGCLKRSPRGSDTHGMFLSASALAPLPGARLERLRLSLNTPVVALRCLPVGPAAAGIAVHRTPGGARLTVAVRAVRSGQVIFFHPDEGWADSEDLAFEAALSFGESMGFLFDEDPFERGEAARGVARLWADFLEDAAPEEGNAPPEDPGKTGAASEPEAEAPPDPAALLSKFRFLSSIPAERLLASRTPGESCSSDTVLHLLSRF